MVEDYIRAAKSKAKKEAFDSAVNSLITAIQNLKDRHDKEWEVVEELRKGYASIIESVNPILKENYDGKLAKPLDRCNHDELIAELRKASATMPYGPREEIEVAIVRIESRYTQIQEQAQKLEDLNEELSNYHLLEKDYKQEVVVSFENLKNQRAEEGENLEEVESVTNADANLLKSLEELVDKDDKPRETREIIDESDITSGEEIDFAEAFDDLFADEEEKGDETRIEKFLESTGDESLEETDCQLYKLNEDQTLADVVKYVYQGNISWVDIYHYGDNQVKIDRKCAELNIDPEEAAYIEGALSGIEIEFPKEFVAYEERQRQDEKGHAKAA